MKVLCLALTAAVGLSLAACAPVEDGAPSPMPPPGEAGQCKASQYQRYLGRNRSELPAGPAGEVWRVTCTTCAMTMDFNPSRLNILYNQTSGRIEEVKCG